MDNVLLVTAKNLLRINFETFIQMTRNKALLLSHQRRQSKMSMQLTYQAHRIACTKKISELVVCLLHPHGVEKVTAQFCSLAKIDP